MDARIIKGYEVWNKVLEQVSRVIDTFDFSSQIQPSEPKIFTLLTRKFSNLWN